MQFHVEWEFIDTAEEAEKRSLQVFSQWAPQEGAHFQAFYAFADNSGGFAIIETDSAAILAQTTAPWGPWLRFTIRPIVPVEEATPIVAEAIAFRDSVG